MIYVHHVIIVLKMLDKKVHKLLVVIVINRYVGRRYLVLLCRRNNESRRLDSFLDRIKIVGLGLNLKNLSLGSKVLSARLKRKLHKLILVNVAVLVRNDNYSLFGEKVTNATRLTHIAVIL